MVYVLLTCAFASRRCSALCLLIKGRGEVGNVLLMAPRDAASLIPSPKGREQLVLECNELGTQHGAIPGRYQRDPNPEKSKSVTLMSYRCADGSAGGQKRRPPITARPLLSFPPSPPPPLSLPVPRVSPPPRRGARPPFPVSSGSRSLCKHCSPHPMRRLRREPRRGGEGYYSQKVWLVLPPALNFKVQLKTKQNKKKQPHMNSSTVPHTPSLSPPQRGFSGRGFRLF